MQLTIAQQIVLYGEQIRGNVENAVLKSEPVILTKSAKIINIEGENDGFWINSEMGLVQAFYRKDNKFEPKTQGFVLHPGKYWVYPNLKSNQNKATIKIIVQFI